MRPGARCWSEIVDKRAPATPSLVILIGVDAPQGEHTGGAVAAPVFRRAGGRILAHLGVPRDQAD